VTETVPASRKLQGDDARALLKGATRLLVAKGKKLQTFEGAALKGDDAVTAMLGPTGNLRAPTVKVGKTLVVGFSEDAYREALG
jgi:hypothetical protein